MVKNKFESNDEVVCIKVPRKVKTPLKMYQVYTVKEAKIFNNSSPGISLSEFIEDSFFSELYFEKIDAVTIKTDELTNFVNSIFLRNGR